MWQAGYTSFWRLVIPYWKGERVMRWKTVQMAFQQNMESYISLGIYKQI